MLIPPNGQADGVVQQVDTVNRDLQILTNGDSVEFDVSPECTVILNREWVKLRLLQPTDRVRVFYGSDSNGLRIAHRVVAKAGIPSNV